MLKPTTPLQYNWPDAGILNTMSLENDIHFEARITMLGDPVLYFVLAVYLTY